jgi:outer membrane lipopolysaccharide assembly protein LptE/RlpB
MEDRHTRELRFELDALLHKQREVLDSRMLGTASDAEVLEYELRQEVIHEIIRELCSGLSHSAAA